MELVTILILVAFSLFSTLVGLRYKGYSFIFIGMALTMFTLARLSADNSLTIQHDLIQATMLYATYTCTAGGTCSNDVVWIIAGLATFASTQFLLGYNIREERRRTR